MPNKKYFVTKTTNKILKQMEHETRRSGSSNLGSFDRNFIINDLKDRVRNQTNRSPGPNRTDDGSTGQSMFGPRVMPPPPPPPNQMIHRQSNNQNNNRRYSYDHMILNDSNHNRHVIHRQSRRSGSQHQQLQYLAETDESSMISHLKRARSREMMNMLATNAQIAQEKTQKGLKKAQKGIQKGLKKGREGLEDVANKAIPVVKTTIRQLSSPSSASSNSFDTISSNERNIQGTFMICQFLIEIQSGN